MLEFKNYFKAVINQSLDFPCSAAMVAELASVEVMADFESVELVVRTLHSFYQQSFVFHLQRLK